LTQQEHQHILLERKSGAIMAIYEDVLGAIGNTPLIKLKRASALTGCTIYGKAEFMNPGQSVKDRPALYMVQDAMQRGLLKPGGTVVEGTAGNTGIGIALVCRAMGLKAVIVMPETQSEEKKNALRQMGATLVLVPAAPFSNPNNYVKVSARLAKDIGGFWANQFDNKVNREAHIETTAVEIFRDLGRELDGFICAVGSGGTLAGTAMGLRAVHPSVKIGIADPKGAALHSFYTTGVLKAEGGSITEGIGQGRITANLEGFTPDFSYQISDEEAIPVMFDLLDYEGLQMGPSTGVNVAGAIRMAKEMGRGKTIVTILCDYGARYASKIYDPAFLREKGLPVPAWIGSPETLKAPLL
jgi:cysteine synthase